MSNSITIAVTGKGGTGKTAMATMLIGMLAKRYPGQVLAIDADSASSLPYTLGVKMEKSVSDLRKGLAGSREIQRQYDDKPSKEIMRTLITKGDGFDVMFMGRPEEDGCFCAVNAMLKFGITMLCDDYRVTIIDGEAGPEQLNRRVVEKVDYLIVMADMSTRSLGTAAEIVKIAKRGENMNIKNAGVVLNRVKADAPKAEMLAKIDAEIYAELPEDPILNQYDRDDKSLLDLPEDAPSFIAVQEMLKKILPDF